MNKVFGSVYLALTWSVVIQVLLCLPGHSIPSTESLGIPGLDKVVHVFIFGSLVAAWCGYVAKNSQAGRKRALLFFLIFLAACFNGIIIEYIQKWYIPNRSFDEGDIIADILSAGISYGVCNVRFQS